MNIETQSISQSQKILNAAFKCIASKGYANVSLRDIADEAGVVLSQLNYYYKNKEGLFGEVIKMLSSRYLQEIEVQLKKGKSENEKITYLINYFDEMVVKTPELFKLFFDLTSMSLWSDGLKELLSNLFEDLTHLIDKHITSHSLDKESYKKYSPKALARLVLGTLFGTSIQVILANEGEKKVDDSLAAMQILFNQK